MGSYKNRAPQALEAPEGPEQSDRGGRPETEVAEAVPLSFDESRRLLELLHLQQFRINVQADSLRQAAAEHRQRGALLEEYLNLYDFAPVGYLTLDRCGVVRSVNHSAAALLGDERAYLLGRRLKAFLCYETRPLFSEMLERLFSGSEKGSCELSLQRRKLPPLQVQVEAVLAETGQECYLALFDISAPKQRLEYLQTAHEVLAILELPGEFPQLVQRALSELKRRAGFEAVRLGLKEAVQPLFVEASLPANFLLSGNRLIDLAPPGWRELALEGIPSYPEAYAKVLSGTTDLGHDLFTAGGSFWCNDIGKLWRLGGRQQGQRPPREERELKDCGALALVPVRHDDGIFGLIQVHSKTRGRFSEEAVQQLEGVARGLGAAFARHRAEVEAVRLKAELLQARKLALVGRLATGVAHDFNNMLLVIRGAAKAALQDLPENHTPHPSLENICKAAEHCTFLCEQLLSTVRREKGEPRLMDLNAVVERGLELLRRLVGGEIEVLWQPSPGLGRVMVRPGQVERILFNLCSNSRNAIAGRGRIVIETADVAIDAGDATRRPGAAVGDYVRFSVSDDGCGMDRELLSRIHRPFFSTNEFGKGTGLGLATVYEIVKENHGFVDVKSEQGLGTVFQVLLPRRGAVPERVLTRAGVAAEPGGRQAR